MWRYYNSSCIFDRLGACILEKHLTHRKRASGPDHAASLEPVEFAEYVALARRARNMSAEQFVREIGVSAAELGPADKAVLDIERDVRTVSRQSLTATRPMSLGHHVSEGDLTIKRPGTGIPPFEWHKAIGRRVARPIEADTSVRWEDLS